MAEIIPAVMPTSLSDLSDHIEKVVGAARTVQIDVMDGVFVREKTWPYIREDDYFIAIVDGEEGMPYWQDVNYEIDLMVDDPLTLAEQWIAAGVSRLIFHVDTPEDIEKALLLKNDFTEIGLAVHVDTDIEMIAPYLGELSCVQCMGIERVGYQGEELDERVFENIKAIRSLAPELPISVDGGVNEDTAQELAAAGATRLISGSAIFDAVNPMDAIRHLKAAAYIPK